MKLLITSLLAFVSLNTYVFADSYPICYKFTLTPACNCKNGKKIPLPNHETTVCTKNANEAQNEIIGLIDKAVSDHCEIFCRRHGGVDSIDYTEPTKGAECPCAQPATQTGND